MRRRGSRPTEDETELVCFEVERREGLPTVFGHEGPAPLYANADEEIDGLRAENARLRELLSRPYIGAWTDEVIVEAAHQRERWGAEHDHGKQPHDWFWLLGYLAGKALQAHNAGDLEKARHHTVSSAAALAHWAASISGAESVFRPGLGPEALAGLER